MFEENEHGNNKKFSAPLKFW